MSPRRYRLERRAETAEQTRRRLVDATFALHGEQGISATTMTDIAARAGVSVGTVYHHFPTYQDAVAACTRHVDESLPLPTADIFAGLTSMHARVRRLAQEIFGFYQRLPAFERVRCERWGMPPIEAYAAREDRQPPGADAGGLAAVPDRRAAAAGVRRPPRRRRLRRAHARGHDAG